MGWYLLWMPLGAAAFLLALWLHLRADKRLHDAESPEKGKENYGKS